MQAELLPGASDEEQKVGAAEPSIARPILIPLAIRSACTILVIEGCLCKVGLDLANYTEMLYHPATPRPHRILGAMGPPF